MTDNVDIVNRALQHLGTRTTVDAAELAANSSNEAIQANLVLTKIRDQLLRLAPWDCSTTPVNLNYITSLPGTPENTSGGTNLWQKGQPQPPWVYEYQYPMDCLRACWIIPQFQTGFSGGVPITTAVTGGAPSTWNGPPVRFKISTDQFFPVTAATVGAGGVGYVIGDEITLPLGPTSSAPIGAPVVLVVATVAGGVILTVTVKNQILGSASPLGGSYFAKQTGTIAQASTTGSGVGATFTLTQGVKGNQRVILTNQEFATLVYVQQITDPNVMDDLFQEAWTAILGSYLCMALTGDKTLGNMLVGMANTKIIEARKVDGNEGLTVNDSTPDWIRSRGTAWAEWPFGGANQFYNWGDLWGMWV